MKEYYLLTDREREKRLREKLSKFPFIRLKALNPVCIPSIDSTQDCLVKELGSKNEGDFVVANVQTKGRGREGRNWYSDEGGLYLSITLVPNRSEIMDKIAPLITQVIRDNLEMDLHLEGCAIKAPNDVICRGKKIAGVLIDSELKGDSAIAYVGIGVDLNNGENWTNEMREIATSYSLETLKKVDLDNFIAGLLSRLDQLYDNLLRTS